MSGLQPVADAFRRSLVAFGEVSVLRLDPLDRTGVPVVQTNLLLPGKPVTTGHGYGFEAIEAEVGALGELCEEVHNSASVARAEVLRGSYREMVRTHGVRGVLDPLTLCLPAGSRYEPEMVLSWMSARRWPTGESVLAPAEWVAAHGYDLRERDGLITPITNGLGAGLDLEHAVAHGVMELLQRDGNVVDYRALDQGVTVPLDHVPDAAVMGLVTRLRAAGIDVTVKLASTEFGIADLYVVGDDRGTPAMPIQVTACGEAAHPDPVRSLRKALLEFCGSRVRKVATHGPVELCGLVMPQAHIETQIDAVRLEAEEPRALAAMVEWLDQDAEELRHRLAGTVFSKQRQVAFSALPGVPAERVAQSADRLAWLVDRLAAAGLEIIVVDCSQADSEVRAVKVIVPGLECETMSYGRIGWRGVARLRDRDDALVLREPCEGALRVRLRAEDEERARGPAWFDTARAEQIVGRLYPLYREPGCFSAQAARRNRQEKS